MCLAVQSYCVKPHIVLLLVYWTMSFRLLVVAVLIALIETSFTSSLFPPPPPGC